MSQMEAILAIYRADPIIADKAARGEWPKLLTYANGKLEKNAKEGFLTAGIQLSPANESGLDVCPFSTDGCRRLCLGHQAGRMRFSASKRARVLRTILFVRHRELFLEKLDKELEALERKARNAKLKASLRPNTTSDIAWETVYPDMFKRLIQVYDYTKNIVRMCRFLKGRFLSEYFPSNYHLTFSRTESNWLDCKPVLYALGNVAVVFWPFLPAEYNGYEVVDGDVADTRMRDKEGVIVGLLAKGALAKTDRSGFVVRME